MIVFLLIIVLIEGVMIMAAIDNLTQAVAALQSAVAAIILPVDNSAAEQAAADSINASIAALQAKVTPQV